MSELRAGTPVVVGNVTIVSVEEISVQSWAGERGFGVSGSKKPVAVVVSTPTDKRIFEWTARTPELAQVLDRLT